MSCVSPCLVHCLQGAHARQDLIAKAMAFGFDVKIPYDHLPHAFTISHPDSKLTGEFLDRLESESNVAVFRSLELKPRDLGRMRPHFRRAPAVTLSLVTASSSSKTQEKKAGAAPYQGPYGQTASYFAQYYNFPPVTPGSAPVIGIVSLDGSYQQSDLQYYWQRCLGLTTLPKVIHVAVDGATPTFTGSDSDIENTLDLQIAGGICPTATLLLFSAPNTNKGFYDAINAAVIGTTVNGVLYKPSIVSISWGAPENQYSNSSLQAFNQLFQTAVSLGITITVACGDSGSDDGVGDGQPHADFPASSPYVTACGGTSLASGGIESAWTWSARYQWGTGGGISRIFPAPSYQRGVVTYPTGTLPSTATLQGLRALPDIALNADPLSGWTIYFNNQLLYNEMGGTSCVAPAMAGLLGLMNLRYSVSFNTSLYAAYKVAAASCFVDITIGNNDSIAGSNGVFPCTSGYDFCTGLGAVNGVNLFSVLQKGTPAQPPSTTTTTTVTTTTLPNGGTTTCTCVTVTPNTRQVQTVLVESKRSVTCPAVSPTTISVPLTMTMATPTCTAPTQAPLFVPAVSIQSQPVPLAPTPSFLVASTSRASCKCRH